MAWGARPGLKLKKRNGLSIREIGRLNGLGRPSGFEMSIFSIQGYSTTPG